MKRTINYKGVDIEVEFTYYPEEKEVWTYRNGDPGHPGSPAYIDIEKVFIGGVECIDIFTDAQLQDMEGLLIDEFENDNDC